MVTLETRWRDACSTSGMEGQRRSSRRIVRNRYRLPSSAHYVGYVEDNETPDMIMRKFDELDKVITGDMASQTEGTPSTQLNHKKALDHELHGAMTSSGKELLLNEEQLKEIFKRTSIFNVKSTIAANHALVANSCCDQMEGWLFDEEEEGSQDDYSKSGDQAASSGSEENGGLRIDCLQAASSHKPQQPNNSSQSLLERGRLAFGP